MKEPGLLKPTSLIDSLNHANGRTSNTLRLITPMLYNQEPKTDRICDLRNMSLYNILNRLTLNYMFHIDFKIQNKFLSYWKKCWPMYMYVELGFPLLVEISLCGLRAFVYLLNTYLGSMALRIVLIKGCIGDTNKTGAIWLPRGYISYQTFSVHFTICSCDNTGLNIQHAQWQLFIYVSWYTNVCVEYQVLKANNRD